MPNKPIRDAASDFKARAIARGFEREKAEQAEQLNNNTEDLKGRLDDAKLRQLKNAARGFIDPNLTREISFLEKELNDNKKSTPKIGYYCQKCKDTGVIGNKHCNCYLNYLYINSYDAVNIDNLKENFDDFNLNLFDDKTQVYSGLTQRNLIKTAKDVIFNFVKELPDSPTKKILISGKTGLGKTYLLRSAAKLARSLDIDVLLIEAPKLFHLFHMHRLGYEIELSYLEQATLLIIDDLGAEPKTLNVSEEYFYNLLETRLNKGLYTIVATNETRLSERYNERISSRLYSIKNGALVELEGQDLRNTRID